jgi:hydroxypyruvate reductase
MLKNDQNKLKLLSSDALYIVQKAIETVLPEKAVEAALKDFHTEGKKVLIAIGKAAWRMAFAAKKVLGDRIDDGIVTTKYDHSQGNIEGLEVWEAGHPIPDENSIKATNCALEMVKNLTDNDMVLFLVSGGGSALFEQPLPGVSLNDLTAIYDQLLKSGANIVEINTIRKHLSSVKGGRFAQLIHPAKVYTLVLSDVLGDHLDAIASGPAYPDSSTSDQALEIIKKYDLSITDNIKKVLRIETPKNLDNIETKIIGSVKKVCNNAALIAREKGYTPLILTTTLDCEAKHAGKFIASIAREIKSFKTPMKTPCAIIIGGETVVNVQGDGTGGRNQELVLSAASGISELENVVVVSVGTDGSDGPTDAAGGVVDNTTVKRLSQAGIEVDQILENNDSYTALKEIGDLVITGPTGTNVNDLTILLIH